MIEFVAQFRSDIAGRLMVKMAADGMEVLSGDDALELVESLDEHSIGEIMVCAATDALFLKWKQAVTASSVAVDLLRQKHAGGSQDALQKEVKNLNGHTIALLTRLQRLACWICFAYREVGTLEEGKLVLDTYMQRRFSTSTCRNAAGLILAARLIPGILLDHRLRHAARYPKLGPAHFT